jgi:hypothetical protein
MKGLWKVGEKVGWTVCKMAAYSEDLKVYMMVDCLV